MTHGLLAAGYLSVCLCGWRAMASAADPESRLPAIARQVPVPLAEHPGNIYLEGEAVSVRVGSEIPPAATTWILYDAERQRVAAGEVGVRAADSPAISIGALPVGWYRMEFFDADGQPAGWTTAAVLGRLAAPTPLDSPICVDAAVAWFARDDVAEQARHASLAALAGVNWIRDRMTWREMEPQRGQFADPPTNYDRAAQVQCEAGLRVLQVFHLTPPWAGDQTLDGRRITARFPRDLRDMFRFCREMARRFHGQVHAWEPWNEANVDTFGGHTVDEMCSLQKAAYLGFKAGDPQVIVGWNAYATIPTMHHAQGLADNQAGAYYDTYNIHSYDWHHGYLPLWEPARQAAGGKPLWVTEADRGLPCATPAPWQDQSPEHELHKARYIAQAYACSLSAGCQRHFQFVLGNYAEDAHRTQFGLLRQDLTPRPAYVALAAVGRLLAGAKFETIWRCTDQPDAHVYLFNAWPDGVNRQVIVLWAERPVDWSDRNQVQTPWPLPEQLQIEQVYDYLGRPIERPHAIGGSAVFAVCAPGALSPRTPPDPDPAPVPPPPEVASPFVLQIQMPSSLRVMIQPIEWSQGYEYQVPVGQEVPLVFFGYNFSDQAAAGTVEVEQLPDGWTLEPMRWSLETDAMDRCRFEARLVLPAATAGQSLAGVIRMRGDFGAGKKCVLAFAVHGKK